MKTKLSGRFWAVLTIFSLMGQVAWVVENMYFNVFIYKMFNASAADISLMVAASSVAATLTTVFIGALSDKIGKRKLFICSGYILWGVSILSFVFLRTDIIEKFIPATLQAASVGVSLTIILDCVMTFFGSAANDAAFNAWLTDSTDSTNRGAAEGINSMMPLVAILVVFGGFMFFDLSLSSSWTAIFLIIGALTLTIGILGLFVIKEPDIKPNNAPYFKTVFYGFKPSTIKQNPTLYVSLLAFIIFNISIQIFMPYLIIYYEISLGMTNYVFVMAPAIIVASVVTALWGRVYDKKGFGFSGKIAVLFLVIGYIMLYLFKSTPLVFVGSLFMMSGYLSGMGVFGAIIRDNTPQGKSGLLQGVRIFSQVFVPGVVGPFIGKLVLANAETVVGSDGTSSFVPSANIFLAALVAIVVVFPFFSLVKKTTRKPFISLKTPFENSLEEIPFAEYPRPQLKRDSYLCLNGQWDFEIKDKYVGKILVPFVPESRISGVMKTVGKKDELIYTKSFNVSADFLNDKTILHFGAVDQRCNVYFNDSLVCEHIGGYTPFSADITNNVKVGQNKIRVVVTDPLDINEAYGKQRVKRGGMWYTKISGIWQTVWLESVPHDAIENIVITPALDSVTIKTVGGADSKTLVLGDTEYTFSDTITLDIENPVHWTPETPHLYDFCIRSGADTVYSYFALRTVDVGEKNGRSYILLNGKPYYFHGLLDQGYFSDGIFLPATEQGFKNDILKMKECGFNMLRKHIKLEPDLFYYYCDKYGMAVFQDFINSGRYDFVVDTAIPTVLFRRGITHRATKRRRESFFKTSECIVDTLYNHPSVIYYTIFNEGWGQFEADTCYTHFKAYDPTRIYDTTSGWFKEKLSDVESDHIYFKPVKLKSLPGKPMVLSEFGGYSCKVKDHFFNPNDNTGYSFFTEDPKEFEKALVSMYERDIIANIKNGLCASVLTQLSDVEDETNGLFTYDRAVLKVDPDVMSNLAQTIFAEFNK